MSRGPKHFVNLSNSLSRRGFFGSLGVAAASIPRWAEPSDPASVASGVVQERIRRSATGAADPRFGERGGSSVQASWSANGSPVPPGDSFVSRSIETGVPRQTPLPERYSDFSRHFLFEYYPWYGADPWRHWNNRNRRPPVDIAASSVPALGPYDSTDSTVVDRHARWIRESGVGSIAISWWGRQSYSDRAVHKVMDAMHAHDIKVSFGLEPYADDRADHFVDDVLYLLNEYGDKRRWDCFLLPEHGDGVVGPVFKSFRTILPERVMDCHGLWHPVPDFAANDVWQRQTTRLREIVRADFERLTLLADSLDMDRTRDSGFDGIGIYDNYVGPELYAEQAYFASRVGLVFSFNVNPGYDEILERDPDPTGCYHPRPFEPPTPELSFAQLRGRQLAQARSTERIEASLAATVAVQDDPALTNRQRGFFLVYINSFNEWHEGHAFEPMKNYGDLSPGEKELAYHNTLDGGFRLEVLTNALAGLSSAAREPAGGGAWS